MDVLRDPKTTTNVFGQMRRNIFLLLYISSLSICQALSCQPGEILCRSGDVCFSVLLQCNGLKDCADGSDETNCTNGGITKHIIITGYNDAEENLAWLVTPVIFGLAIVYTIYKCLKEGVCVIRQRCRHAHAQSGDHQYVAIDRISFYAMPHLRCTQLAESRNSSQVMLVTNQSFTFSLPNENSTVSDGVAPPAYDDIIQAGLGNSGFMHLQEEDVPPPAYTEIVEPDTSSTLVSSSSSSSTSSPDVAVSLSPSDAAAAEAVVVPSASEVPQSPAEDAADSPSAVHFQIGENA